MPSLCKDCIFIYSPTGADLGGGCRGCAPHPEMTCSFLIQLVFCKKKKTMWFIGVEVEQEMSGSPPKKNPGSAPALECLRLECTWANITCFELIATGWALTQVSQQESSVEQARPLSLCILGDCLQEVQLYRVITCSALGLYIQQGVDVLTIAFIAQLYYLRNSLLP